MNLIDWFWFKAEHINAVFSCSFCSLAGGFLFGFSVCLFFQGAAKDGKDDTLELRFEYNDSGTWNWIILYTKQVISQSF